MNVPFWLLNHGGVGVLQEHVVVILHVFGVRERVASIVR